MLVPFCMYLWKRACVFELGLWWWRKICKIFWQSVGTHAPQLLKWDSGKVFKAALEHTFIYATRLPTPPFFRLLNNWQGIQNMWRVWFRSGVEPDQEKRKQSRKKKKSCMRVPLFKSHQAKYWPFTDSVRLANFVVSVRDFVKTCVDSERDN